MTYYHTGGDKMAASKIAITLESDMVKRIDMLVKSNLFPNRSKAIQQAVVEKLNSIKKSRLSQECEKLDPEFEQFFAEEGFTAELKEWFAY
jgi:Arc/MetJ-type ribon-helix-helix transcriptional regulator